MLRNIRKLMKPGARLLLQQLNPALKAFNYLHVSIYLLLRLRVVVLIFDYRDFVKTGGLTLSKRHLGVLILMQSSGTKSFEMLDSPALMLWCTTMNCLIH